VISDHEGGWQRVDQNADPTGYIEYLRSVSDLESVQGWKRQTIQLMGVELGQTVLDVGCGRGDEVIALARVVGERGKSVGLDASAAMVAEAQRQADDARVCVELKVGDAHALPFPDATFDAARIERTLLHLAKPDRAIAELRRVTRPGGRVVAADPDWATLTVDAPDEGATAIMLQAHLSHVTNGTMGRQLRRRFIDAGFEDIAYEVMAFALTDFALGDRILGLTESAHEAVADGMIGSERAQAWLDSLSDADRRGRFIASLTGFIVSGRVPAA
jgi:SAM-dependent methyltransferase